MSSADLRLPLGPPDLSSAVVVTQRVIAKLAARATRATYGVVGMQSRPMQKLTKVLRASWEDGVELDVQDGRINVDLRVIMERGLNLAQVTTNLQEQVRYQLGQVAGLPVGGVSVRVEDLTD